MTATLATLQRCLGSSAADAPCQLESGSHAPRMVAAMVRVSAPRCPMCHVPQGSPSLSTPQACGLSSRAPGAHLRRAAQADPGRAPGMSAESPQGRAGQSSVPPRRAGLAGVSPLVGGGPARCLSVGDARRGPPPQRRSPAPSAGPRGDAPRLTAPARAAGPSSPRRAILPPRKPQSRALPVVASLRFAPRRPLTASFPGTIRHLAGRTAEGMGRPAKKAPGAARALLSNAPMVTHFETH